MTFECPLRGPAWCGWESFPAQKGLCSSYIEAPSAGPKQHLAGRLLALLAHPHRGEDPHHTSGMAMLRRASWALCWGWDKDCPVPLCWLACGAPSTAVVQLLQLCSRFKLRSVGFAIQTNNQSHRLSICDFPTARPSNFVIFSSLCIKEKYACISSIRKNASPH